jgi:hypothetical protein
MIFWLNGIDFNWWKVKNNVGELKFQNQGKH